MRQPFIFLSTCHKNKCSHSEGLGDHSVLGWLCQFQSNPGCVDDGDDSKEPVLILSYGSIPSGCSVTIHWAACRVPPSGTQVGDEHPQ